MKHHLSHLAKRVKPMGFAITFVAITEPLMTSPQVYKIWANKNATDLSLTSWSFYLFAATVWLVYGISSKSKPVILSAALWIMFYVPIIVGILLYG